MKQRDLIRHLQQHGCVLLRQGKKHVVYQNSDTLKTSTVPRHTEIADPLATKICRDLQVPPPK
ncbi:MAG: type II toxin-antitoxin system HicA family toxin [Chloroflexota bacterium]